jgi:hypothetical protein
MSAKLHALAAIQANASGREVRCDMRQNSPTTPIPAPPPP